MAITLEQPPKQNASKQEFESWMHKLWLYLAGSMAGSLNGQIGGHAGNLSNPHNVTWAQVVASASTLASVLNRSHTLLTDVGEHSHATIDAHLVAMSNPHGTTLQQAYTAGQSISLTGTNSLTVDLVGTGSLNVTEGGHTRLTVTGDGNVFVYGRDPMRYQLMGMG